MSALRAAVALGLLAGLAPASASAATIAPNTFADENGAGGGCSLREALQAANTDAAFGGCLAGAGTDTVPLAPGTYALTIPADGTPDDNLDGDLDVIPGSTVEITHSGLSPSAISGTPASSDRVLDTAPGATASLAGLTIRGGTTAGFGAGIQNRGVLNLSNSTVTGNSGFSNGGGFNITGTSVTTLTNVTISGNTATGGGAGFNHNNGTATLTNVTVTGNTADSDASGGGDGGGVFRFAGTLTLMNTIVAGNADLSPANADPDCSGTIASAGNNLIGDTAGCSFVSGAGDLLNVNPLLGPLADNGGSTQTHALLPSSPAIDSGGAGGPSTDQRGAPRNPDIGAYELVRCGGTIVNRVGTRSKDQLSGTAGADGFLLREGKDKAFGMQGKDSLCGEAGKDTLNGGKGRDKLIGGKGRDKLNGGKGRDICKGGKGDDAGLSCEVEKSIAK